MVIMAVVVRMITLTPLAMMTKLMTMITIATMKRRIVTMLPMPTVNDAELRNENQRRISDNDRYIRCCEL